MTAGVLLHEIFHLDDANIWPIGGPPGNPDANDDEEAEAYEAELAVLTAAIDCPHCVYLSSDEVAEVNSRRRYVEAMVNFYTR